MNIAKSDIFGSQLTDIMAMIFLGILHSQTDSSGSNEMIFLGFLEAELIILGCQKFFGDVYRAQGYRHKGYRQQGQAYYISPCFRSIAVKNNSFQWSKT